jgi:predicted nucleotidyltransferase
MEFYVHYDLKKIINDITKHHHEIREIYLFGSRAYGTNSYRSDIDILAVTDGENISAAQVNKWLYKDYQAVDLFTSYDKKVATSCVNGSFVCYREENGYGYKDLIEQLDAKKLWDKTTGFSNQFTEWEQDVFPGASFPASVLPFGQNKSIEEKAVDLLAELEKQNIKTYFTGCNYFEIANHISQIIEKTFEKPTKYQKNAKNFSFNTIQIANEYDFQNLIHLLIRPIFSDIETENCVIIIDGNKKIADFGLNNNKIIIEAKWIDTTSKKNEVVKTISGLSNFYTENPNVESLVFVVLYDKDVTIDKNRLEDKFSHTKSSPSIIVRFIKNIYNGNGENAN